MRDQAQACGGRAGGGNRLENRVDGLERQWPPVTWPEHVPRPQDRRSIGRVADQFLTALPHCDVRPHDWSGVSDAYVDEVTKLRALSRLNRNLHRPKVDGAKGGRFPWGRLGSADQMHECF